MSIDYAKNMRGKILRLKIGIMLLSVLLVISIFPNAASYNADSVPASIPNLDSVFVDVVVLLNGRINVTYFMTFTATSDGLGGFDLLGIQESTVYDSNRAYA